MKKALIASLALTVSLPAVSRAAPPDCAQHLQEPGADGRLSQEQIDANNACLNIVETQKKISEGLAAIADNERRTKNGGAAYQAPAVRNDSASAHMPFLRIMGTEILPGLISGPMAPKHPSSSQKILMVASDLASGWYAAITLGLVLSIGLIVWFSLRRATGHFRVILERFPPWSIYRDVQGYVWITAFLSLVLAKVPDKEALRIQAVGASPWLKERLDAILTNLTINGLTFPDSLLATGFEFPSPRIIDDVEANWVSKEGYIRLHETATVWANATEQRTIAFANKAENVFLLIMIGLVVILGAACDNLGADLSHSVSF